MQNILIIEPDPAIRKIAIQSLQGSNLFFFEAENSETALANIPQNHIHLCLLDGSLEGEDALELVVQIKKKAPQVPLIIMQGIGEEGAESFLDAGALKVIAKPFNLNELKESVAEGLSRAPAWVETKDESLPVKKPFPFKLTVGLLLGLTFLGAAGYGGYRYYQNSKIIPIQIFVLPYEHLAGITLNGEEVWTVDWFNQSIYRHAQDPILSQQKDYKNENWHPTGIAFDGKNIWTLNSWAKKLSRHANDAGLSTDLELPSVGTDPSGLYYDGESFWQCDAGQSKIYRFKVADNKIEVLTSFNSPGQKPIGVYRQANDLWTLDSRTGLIYRHQIDKHFSVSEVYSLPEELSQETISCFTGDKTTFWLGAEKSRKIYQVHPKNLKLVATN